MRGFIIFTIIVLFSSCSSGGDDIDPFLYLKSTELELVCEDTVTLIVETTGIEMLKWETDNDFSITVDNKGFIKANRVGETVVTVSDSESKLQAKCNITVKPKYNLYEEPILAFGKSQEEIIKLIDYPLAKETDIILTFTHPDDKIVMMMCNFENNKLVSITLMPKDIEEIWEFLNERYMLNSESGYKPEPITYSFVDKDNCAKITYIKSLPVGSTITYSPVEKTE